jgi:hypothetical protein
MESNHDHAADARTAQSVEHKPIVLDNNGGKVIIEVKLN